MTNPTIKLTGQLATEAKMTVEAPARYGELYAVPCAACDLLDFGVLGVAQGQQIAVGALAYVRKHLRLALLSTVRRHRVQAAMDLRQALEMTPILGFTMAHPEEIEKIIHRNVDADDLKSMKNNDEAIKNASYKWLAQAHPELNGWVKEAKELINWTSSHANLMSASFLIDLPNEKGITVSFFDKPHEALEAMGLTEVARATMLALTLIVTLNETTKNFILTDTFSSEASDLSLRAMTKMAEVSPRLDDLTS